MEVSRAEYLADSAFKQQLGHRESSTSNAEPSSSGASECPAPIQGGLFASKNSILVLEVEAAFRPETMKSSKT